MLIFDAHLDLSMNALEWNRDLRWTVDEIRKSEAGMDDKPDRAKNTVSFEAMRRGNIGLCVATQIARYVKRDSTLPGWNSPQQAWAQTQGQLAWYREMEKEGYLKSIRDIQDLETHLKTWDNSKADSAIGYILSLEGADSIVTPDYLDQAWEQGLRAIGPAHYGPGTYAHGTDSVGGIGTKGKDLLKKIASLGLILDATHLCDQSFWETMKIYDGPVWASHNNCRTFVNHNRQFSDEQMEELIQRKAVIGIALDAWMMVPNWVRGVSTPKQMNVTLDLMVNNIDHICQLAGNSSHVGIGTDLDGAFGKEQCPDDLETIADLQILPQKLEQKGYDAKDIENILSTNFINFLRRTWSS
ncbi:membrane dipeptidase [Lutimonas halocynthiae]|uniref:dipeptidase n=1 Tax=Lutimonas halocynthiae TaxID=1446477 RepID=UPI0025B370EA|nr:membrane dipeptidase [Lutimonas halocynthiae]MDN3643484.1 membrane dipeptidase [Lutimonas halocynthiae]